MDQGLGACEDRATIGARLAGTIEMALHRAALPTGRTMRNVLLALALGLSLYAATTVAQTVAVKAPQVDTPKRILFVGNSYIYYNGSLHVHANRIARNADPSGSYAYRAATIAGTKAPSPERTPCSSRRSPTTRFEVLRPPATVSESDWTAAESGL